MERAFSKKIYIKGGGQTQLATTRVLHEATMGYNKEQGVRSRIRQTLGDLRRCRVNCRRSTLQEKEALRLKIKELKKKLSTQRAYLMYELEDEYYPHGRKLFE